MHNGVMQLFDSGKSAALNTKLMIGGASNLVAEGGASFLLG